MLKKLRMQIFMKKKKNVRQIQNSDSPAESDEGKGNMSSEKEIVEIENKEQGGKEQGKEGI